MDNIYTEETWNWNWNKYCNHKLENIFRAVLSILFNPDCIQASDLHLSSNTYGRKENNQFTVDVLPVKASVVVTDFWSSGLPSA